MSTYRISYFDPLQEDMATLRVKGVFSEAEAIEALGFHAPGAAPIQITLDSRGGSRPRAGRKSGRVSRPTKAVRVPLEVADNIDKIEALFNLLEDWKQREKDSCETSRDWVQMRNFLEEVDSVFNAPIIV